MVDTPDTYSYLELNKNNALINNQLICHKLFKKQTMFFVALWSVLPKVANRTELHNFRELMGECVLEGF